MVSLSLSLSPSHSHLNTHTHTHTHTHIHTHTHAQKHCVWINRDCNPETRQHEDGLLLGQDVNTHTDMHTHTHTHTRPLCNHLSFQSRFHWVGKLLFSHTPIHKALIKTILSQGVHLDTRWSLSLFETLWKHRTNICQSGCELTNCIRKLQFDNVSRYQLGWRSRGDWLQFILTVKSSEVDAQVRVGASSFRFKSNLTSDSHIS